MRRVARGARRAGTSSGAVRRVRAAVAKRKHRQAVPPSSLPSLQDGRRLFLESGRYHVAGSAADVHFRFTSLVMQFSRRWRNRLNEELARLGQSQARWEALFWIEVSGGRATQHELAQRVGIEGPTFARMLDRLEEEGLVKRHASSGDRRTKTISLNKRAAPLLKKTSDLTDQLRAALLAEVEPAELQQVIELFRRLMPRLERR